MTASAEPPMALRREARRVLRRLGETRGHLRPIDSTHYGLFVRRGRSGKPALKVERRRVAGFRAEDWLSDCPDCGAGCLILSPAGAAFLRRADAQEDPFAEQHRLAGTRYIDAGRAAVTRFTVNRAETPLGWLARRTGPDGRPLISDAQYEAGERLREDFTRAQMMQRITLDWSMTAGGGHRAVEPMAIGDAALAARRRFDAALAAVGPGLADLLVDVCCHLKGLAEAEQARAWPVRTAKVVLGLALDRLARHYGLLPQTATADRHCQGA